MIRHDGKRVQFVAAEHVGVMQQDFDHHVGDGRLAQVERSGTRLLQKAIDGDERSPGRFARGELTIRRKAAMQSPGEEHWLVVAKEMRQPAAVKCHEN